MFSIMIVQNKNQVDVKLNEILKDMGNAKDFLPIEPMIVNKGNESVPGFKLTATSREIIIIAMLFLIKKNVDAELFTYNEPVQMLADGTGMPLNVVTKKPELAESKYSFEFADRTLYALTFGELSIEDKKPANNWSH